MSDQFPKMLYREGTEMEWHGLSLDTLVVADADELAAAKKEGWLAVGDLKKPVAKK